jgi:SPOR domain
MLSRDEAAPAEAMVALATGSALLLALATAAVMIKDSRSGPPAAPAPVIAEAPATPPPSPQATEPRFPADQQQPLVQREDKSEVPTTTEPVAPDTALADPKPATPPMEQKPFPAPVAPSLELLGPAPATKAAPQAKVAQAPADMRYAVYLASFPNEEQALAGWQILQRRYQRPLSSLSPLVRRGKSKQGESVFRLFAGPFGSLKEAGQRCAGLAIATANCKPADLAQQPAEGAGSWD